MELERDAIIPLRIGHLEQIDLWHRSGNVEQSIDSPKTAESSLDDDVGRLGLPEIDSTEQRFRAGGFRQPPQSRCNSSLFRATSTIAEKSRANRSAVARPMP